LHGLSFYLLTVSIFRNCYRKLQMVVDDTVTVGAFRVDDRCC
jgi:hypothetical protein